VTQNLTDQTDRIEDDAVWREWIASARRPGIGAVVALTIVGAVLRFINLAHPPLLFDEAATYTRVVGSFRELLAILRYDGFAPLHYELYWGLGKLTTLSPVMMRLIPAIAGTLMIPAMYFLARQVASRRVATLASALACFSSYLLIYSRDAKMYMELWLCAALFVAALLWWMRTGKRIAWLTWVAAGTAMNGLHALGLCVVGVAVAIVLTHPLLTRRKLLLALTGLTIACAGLAGHYLFFNQWGREVEQAGWRRSGLDWIGQRNRQFSKPFLMWDTTASWMLSYRSPRPPVDPPMRVIVPVAIVSSVVLALLVIGSMPWPARLRDDDPHEIPIGRGMLWMAMWVVLPAIGFYAVSFIGNHDIWNARYLAIVWPAGAVLMAMHIQRLPAPWLRAGAIALLIGANLFQYALRMTVASGVPVDNIVADLARAQRSNGEIRTVVAVKDDAQATSLGGNGGIFDYPGRYYLSLATGKRHHPHALRDDRAQQLFDIPTDIRSVAPVASRLIVWTDGPPVDQGRDQILKVLGGDWSRRSVEQHTVRDFWCWRGMFRCTRSMYEREVNIHGRTRDSRQNSPG
jgi:4-amino-4-deoxy-L-arabinose transferase-like glycosyltransferase